MISNLVRDALEGLVVLAIGGITVSAIWRMTRGRVDVYRCPRCERATSRVYPECPYCGAPLASNA